MFLKMDKNPLLPQLREFFYNSLVEFSIPQENINANNINAKLKLYIKQIIVNSLNLSRMFHNEFIQITENLLITEENCPLVYLDFYRGLLTINNQIQLNYNFTLDDLPSKINKDIGNLATKLMKSNAFQTMLPHLINFILEMKGISSITKELIRESFYNEMVIQTLQAIEVGLITLEDLEDQESFIYFALSGLTFLEAISHSKHCPGIVLLEGKMVTRNNCPQDENFPALVGIILDCKESMQQCYGANISISEEEFMVIKKLCVGKEKIPENMVTTKAGQCAAFINTMSIQVSQSLVFKEMISKVIETCLDSLNSTMEKSI